MSQIPAYNLPLNRCIIDKDSIQNAGKNRGTTGTRVMTRVKTGRDPVTNQTETILESISDGVFTVDPDWIVTSFNRAAEEI